MTAPNRPEFVVFYAWQSDRPGGRTRYFIQEAAAAAAKAINADPSSPYDVRIDQDTQGVPGLCDIPATILEKIDKADAFLADLTYIAVTQAEPDTEHDTAFEPRYCSNPNVLFELGYAFRALGFQRLLCIMNENYGPPAEQIFDLAHRRFPFAYRLPADGKSNATIRQELSSFIESAIRQLFPLGRRAERADSERAVQVRTHFEGQVRKGKFHNLTRRQGAITLAVVPEPGKRFSFAQMREQHLSPLNQSGWNTEIRGRSLLSVASRDADRFAITEIHENGVILAAETWVLDPHFHPNKTLLVPSLAMESAIIRSTTGYLNVLRALQAPLPWCVCISLLEVQGYWFLVSEQETSPRQYPETDIAAEPLFVRNLAEIDSPQQVAHFLRPAIDFIWREFGIDGSYSYTHAGIYNRRLV